jgi:hypothetical protein
MRFIDFNEFSIRENDAAFCVETDLCLVIFDEKWYHDFNVNSITKFEIDVDVFEKIDREFDDWNIHDQISCDLLAIVLKNQWFFRAVIFS